MNFLVLLISMSTDQEFLKWKMGKCLAKIYTIHVLRDCISEGGFEQWVEWDEIFENSISKTIIKNIFFCYFNYLNIFRICDFMLF